MLKLLQTSQPMYILYMTEYYMLDSVTQLRHKSLLRLMEQGWYKYESESVYHHHSLHYMLTMLTMLTIHHSQDRLEYYMPELYQ
jgi:hypothetical protein